MVTALALKEAINKAYMGRTRKLKSFSNIKALVLESPKFEEQNSGS